MVAVMRDSLSLWLAHRVSCVGKCPNEVQAAWGHATSLGVARKKFAHWPMWLVRPGAGCAGKNSWYYSAKKKFRYHGIYP
jgi:hypothetical protein